VPEALRNLSGLYNFCEYFGRLFWSAWASLIVEVNAIQTELFAERRTNFILLIILNLLNVNGLKLSMKDTNSINFQMKYLIEINFMDPNTLSNGIMFTFVNSEIMKSSESGNRMAFHQVLQFPLPIFIPPIAPHSVITLPSTPPYSLDTDSVVI
jgi:hypothetical protein